MKGPKRPVKKGMPPPPPLPMKGMRINAAGNVVVIPPPPPPPMKRPPINAVPNVDVIPPPPPPLLMRPRINAVANVNVIPPPPPPMKMPPIDALANIDVIPPPQPQPQPQPQPMKSPRINALASKKRIPPPPPLPQWMTRLSRINAVANTDVTIPPPPPPPRKWIPPPPPPPRMKWRSIISVANKNVNPSVCIVYLKEGEDTKSSHEMLASILENKESPKDSLIYSYLDRFGAFAAYLTESEAECIEESHGIRITNVIKFPSKISNIKFPKKKPVGNHDLTKLAVNLFNGSYVEEKMVCIMYMREKHDKKSFCEMLASVLGSEEAAKESFLLEYFNFCGNLAAYITESQAKCIRRFPGVTSVRRVAIHFMEKPTRYSMFSFMDSDWRGPVDGPKRLYDKRNIEYLEDGGAAAEEKKVFIVYLDEREEIESFHGMLAFVLGDREAAKDSIIYSKFDGFHGFAVHMTESQAKCFEGFMNVKGVIPLFPPITKTYPLIPCLFLVRIQTFENVVVVL